MKLTLHLIRPARKAGGDRYEADVEGEDKPWVVYFPQSISRLLGGQPTESIDVTIER